MFKNCLLISQKTGQIEIELTQITDWTAKRFYGGNNTNSIQFKKKNESI